MNLVLAPQREGARKRGNGMPKHIANHFAEWMKRIEEELEQKMDKTDGEDLDERVSDLESNHEELESTQEALEFTQEELDSKHEELSEKVEDLEGELADADSRIDDLESEDR